MKKKKSVMLKISIIFISTLIASFALVSLWFSVFVEEYSFINYIKLKLYSPPEIVKPVIGFSGVTLRISSADQLIDFSNQVNSGNSFENQTVELTNDISFDAAVENNFIPIGNEINSFSGVFDGKGHVISGLNIKNTTSKNTGFFGVVKQGAVKNLGIIESSIKGFNYIGAIAGKNDDGTIENCYNKSNIYADSSLKNEPCEWSMYVGGIVGENKIGVIEGCYNTGTISIVIYNDNNATSVEAGGITGITSNHTYESKGGIINCYNKGDFDCINKSDKFGCIIGGVVASNMFWIENSYNVGKLTASEGKCSFRGIVSNNGLSGESKYYNSTDTQYDSNVPFPYIKNCYYLESASESGLGTNNLVSPEPIALTESEMKSDTFLDMLNQQSRNKSTSEVCWQRDDEANDGYPSLITNML